MSRTNIPIAQMGDNEPLPEALTSLQHVADEIASRVAPSVFGATTAIDVSHLARGAYNHVWLVESGSQVRYQPLYFSPSHASANQRYPPRPLHNQHDQPSLCFAYAKTRSPLSSRSSLATTSAVCSGWPRRGPTKRKWKKTSGMSSIGLPLPKKSGGGTGRRTTSIRYWVTGTRY